MTLPTDAELDERLVRLAGTLPASIGAPRPIATPRRLRGIRSSSMAPVVATVLVIVGAGAVLLNARPSPDARGGALLSAPPSTQPTAPSPDAAAVAACEAIRDSVPLVLLRSGEATLVGAYAMDAISLGEYLWAVQSGVNPVTVIGPTAETGTIVCIIDGDFDTRSPGPPGHDTTAKRVLVLIRDGTPELWALARDTSSMPTPDELAGPAASAASAAPTASGSADPDGTYLLASHPGGDCGGEGDPRPARIRADVSDPDHVWLELDGDRLTALWPEGTTVRFASDGSARIRDADGTVIARAGQRLSQTSLRGCMNLGRGRILLYVR